MSATLGSSERDRHHAKTVNPGADLTFWHGVAATPFGDCLLVDSPDGVCRLDFIDNDAESLIAAIRCQWPKAIHRRDDTRARKLIRQALDDPQSIRLSLAGTPFQLAVWNALLMIPSGSTISYQKLAANAGYPSAVRAAGTAIGKNPVAWLVPCHPVIRQNGSLGNYRWGYNRKRLIINWEQERR